MNAGTYNLVHHHGTLHWLRWARRADVLERFAEATLCILASSRSRTRRLLLGTSTRSLPLVTDIHVPLNLEKFALVWSTGVEPARPPSLLRGTPRGGANRPCEGALSASAGRNMAMLGVRLAALGPACEG